MREFSYVDRRTIAALCRRIDSIVPFVPFETKGRKVEADVALSSRFSVYREPCILKGPEEKRRSIGNLNLLDIKAFSADAPESYDPMQGASGMLSAAQHADGKFQMMNFRDQIGLSEEQKQRIKYDAHPNRRDLEDIILGTLR